jgi:hypothetical protein
MLDAQHTEPDVGASISLSTLVCPEEHSGTNIRYDTHISPRILIIFRVRKARPELLGSRVL